MAADEDMEEFQATDSGASDVFPMKAGDLKKGGHVVISGAPCKIMDVSTSKTGKHGHAKANIVAIDIFTGRKYEDVCPTSHAMMVPVVVRREYQLIDINESDETADGTICSLMDAEKGDMIDNLRIPRTEEYEPVRAAFAADDKDIYVTVMSAMGVSKVVAQVQLKDRT